MKGLQQVNKVSEKFVKHFSSTEQSAAVRTDFFRNWNVVKPSFVEKATLFFIYLFGVNLLPTFSVTGSIIL